MKAFLSEAGINPEISQNVSAQAGIIYEIFKILQENKSEILQASEMVSFIAGYIRVTSGNIPESAGLIRWIPKTFLIAAGFDPETGEIIEELTANSLLFRKIIINCLYFDNINITRL
ncbi:MAG TPA: hypothetical protein DDW50_20875 [Firmicutes bacterium]|jgi:hypothetical protein|nr:hypothetical protein [Bacillota bacterium]